MDEKRNIRRISEVLRNETDAMKRIKKKEIERKKKLLEKQEAEAVKFNQVSQHYKDMKRRDKEQIAEMNEKLKEKMAKDSGNKDRVKHEMQIMAEKRNLKLKSAQENVEALKYMELVRKTAILQKYQDKQAHLDNMDSQFKEMMKNSEKINKKKTPKVVVKVEKKWINLD